MKTNFKIITPAFNCENEIEQTIMSVVGQSYKNWTMTVVDDVSSDKTSETVINIFKKLGLEKKLSLVKRDKKHGEVLNTLKETAKLDDDDVVVRLDAGDWLTDLGCLEILDRLYKEYDPAVLWTAHRWGFTNQNISGQIDKSVSVYEQPWRSSHLKTFRVRDFRGLNPNNFLDNEGRYIMIACDQAIFLPMMERARRKNRNLIFVPMVMYHYNIDVSDNSIFHTDRSYAQKYSAEWIRERGYIE